MNIINAETCLNICELEDFSEIISVISKTKNNYEYKRIYIGSYFCDIYFLNSNYEKIIQMIDEIFTNKMKITLVVPVSTEKHLEKVKCRIFNLLARFLDRIDEITVNDYGMLEYLSNMIEIKLNMGRIFFKDYRDPRYLEYFNEEWTPKYNNSFLRKIISKYMINSVEIDVTHKSIKVDNISDSIICIHTPYTYMSTGKICEYAAINKDIFHKFRPNIACNHECNEMCISYDMNDERKWIRIGKTIFFENNCFKISKASNILNYRIIFFPLNDVIESIKLRGSR